MTNLKPCPLCGKEAFLVTLSGRIIACSDENCLLFYRAGQWSEHIERPINVQQWNNFYCWKKVEQLNLQLDDMWNTH